jgi:hypothetical protein
LIPPVATREHLWKPRQRNRITTNRIITIVSL